MNKKVVKNVVIVGRKYPLKSHILNPIKTFMQLSLQTDASNDFSPLFQQDFHSSQEMWQK